MRFTSALSILLGSIALLPQTQAQITANPDSYSVLNNDRSRNLLVLDNDTLGATSTGPLRVTGIVAQPNAGQCRVSDNRRSIYYENTATPNFVGNAACRYEVCDGSTPAQCSTASVTLTVQPIRAIDDNNVSVNDNQDSRSFNVVSNDVTRPTERPLRVISTNKISGPGSCNLIASNNNQVTFTRPSNTNQGGITVCTYRACTTRIGTEPQEYCDSARVTFQVAPRAIPRVTAVNDAANLPAGQERGFIVVTANDVPSNRDLEVTAITSPPAFGTCALRASNTNQVVYTRPPNSSQIGAVACGYRVCTIPLNTNEARACATATLTVNVQAPAPQVTAVNDFSTLFGLQSSGFDNVLANDEPSNRELVVSDITSQPSFGTCAIANDQKSVKYTRPPNSSQSGTVSCGYRACSIPLNNEARVCATATLSLTVQAPIASVTARNDNYPVDINLPISPLLPVLQNDFTTNPSNRPLRVDEILSGPSGPNRGVCVIAGSSQAIRYVPGSDKSGSVQCTYRACTDDDEGGDVCDTAVVTIELAGGTDIPTYVPTPTPNRNPPGNIPVIRDDSKTVPAFPEVSFIDVLDNDTPAPGGAPLRVVAILLRGVLPASGAVNPNGGNFVNNGNLNINSLEDFLQEHDVKLNNTSRAQPSLEQHAQPGERSLNGLCEPTSNRDRVRYTPDPGFQGQDRCAYRACDTNGICGEALIRLTVEQAEPTLSPTLSPSLSPTLSPSLSPTLSPTLAPTIDPSLAPTLAPTLTPSLNPTAPTISPTLSPTLSPSLSPTLSPTLSPSLSPTLAPTDFPTLSPTNFPTDAPTLNPTDFPTLSPTNFPTDTPTLDPTNFPTDTPTLNPTLNPTISPTEMPTITPTLFPTLSPTEDPTISPTLFPTVSPTFSPSISPTEMPTISPTESPTISPSKTPTVSPSFTPTISPIEGADIVVPSPTFYPTFFPTQSPTEKKDYCSSSKGGKRGKGRKSSSGDWWESSSKSSKRGKRDRWCSSHSGSHSKSGKKSKGSKGGSWSSDSSSSSSSDSTWRSSGSKNKPSKPAWGKYSTSNYDGDLRYYKSSVNVTVVDGDELI